MGLLSKAKDKAATKTPKRDKGTAWLLPLGHTLADSVKQLIQLDRDKKTTEAKMEVHKTKLKRYGTEQYVGDYVKNEHSPDSPMSIQNADGESVTFVVQDRSSQCSITAEQKEAIGQLLGEDSVEAVLYDETTFEFNRDLLEKPEVAKIVEAALTAATKKLIGNGILTEIEADNLLVAKNRVAVRPGTLGKLTQICGANAPLVSKFLDALGSAVTRYVRT